MTGVGTGCASTPRSPGAAGVGDQAAASDPPEPLAGRSGALVLFSDVACPWATVAVLRLRAARESLGLTTSLPIIHLAHPLELWFERPLARRVIDAEIPVCAAATPGFGWSLWQGRLDEYPVSSVLALEAVQAARRQSERAAEELDLALRTALFVRSRCISLRHEVLDVTRWCPSLDAARLAADLDAGVARSAVTRQGLAARDGAAPCTGYVVLPDGTGVCNPGVTTAWLGPSLPRGVPVLEHDDPDIYLDVVASVGGVASPVRGARGRR